jgi:hypothetical protein
MLSKNLTKLGYLGRTNTQNTNIPFYDEGTPSLDLNFAGNRNLVDNVSGNNLVTFTRASSGTFVNSAGVLQTAATNLSLKSADFDDAYWDKTRSSIGATKVLAPDGSITGAELIEDTSTNTHQLRRAINFTSGVAYTISIFAKATVSPRFFQIQFPSAAFSSNRRPYFDVVNGTAIADTDTTVLIQPFRDGWYRCSATMTATVTTSATFAYQLSDQASTANPAYTGNGTSGIYLWGVQLEQASTVGEYIPTAATINSAPRFDHNPTTGESLGLLVEEQRTNLLLRSEEFDTLVVWVALNATVTADTQLAPNGTTSAETLTDVNGVTTANVGCFQGVTLADSTTYAMSCYVKAGTKTTCRVGIRDKTGANILANFNLSAVSTTVGNALSSTIQDAGNGWYRCTAICPSATGALGQRGVVFMDTGSYTADGTGTIHVWGAQLEAAAFPTSYIPTTTAAATRSADVANITGTNFSSWFNQSEGTMFADAKRYFAIPSGPFPRVWQIQGALNTSRIELSYFSAGQASFITTNGVTQFEWYPTYFIQNGVKSAQALGTNNVAAASNGQVTATDTSVTLPMVQEIRIGTDGSFGNTLNGTIRRLTYWPNRLSNTTLQNITR